MKKAEVIKKKFARCESCGYSISSGVPSVAKVNKIQICAGCAAAILVALAPHMHGFIRTCVNRILGALENRR